MYRFLRVNVSEVAKKRKMHPFSTKFSPEMHLNYPYITKSVTWIARSLPKITKIELENPILLNKLGSNGAKIST